MADQLKKFLGRLGLPKQRRAMRTRLAVLEAARDSFNVAGFDKAPIKEIAELAGVSVGTIYEHFKDKRTLLREVGQMEAQRIKGDSFGAFRAALTDADADDHELSRPQLERLVKLGVQGTMESHRRYPRLLAELVDIAYRDQEFFAFVQEVTEEAVTFVQTLVVLFGARPPGPAAKRTARVIVLMVEGTLRKFTLYGDALSEGELVDELTILIMGYLFPNRLARQ